MTKSITSYFYFLKDTGSKKRPTIVTCVGFIVFALKQAFHFDLVDNKTTVQDVGNPAKPDQIVWGQLLSLKVN